MRELAEPTVGSAALLHTLYPAILATRSSTLQE